MKYWTNFALGELVDVWRGSHWIGCSLIDDMTTDGSTIWLVDMSTGCRTLHLETDGITLTPKAPSSPIRSWRNN